MFQSVNPLTRVTKFPGPGSEHCRTLTFYLSLSFSRSLSRSAHESGLVYYYTRKRDFQAHPHISLLKSSFNSEFRMILRALFFPPPPLSPVHHLVTEFDFHFSIYLYYSFQHINSTKLILASLFCLFLFIFFKFFLSLCLMRPLIPLCLSFYILYASLRLN